METNDLLVRAARELLRWDQRRLAKMAKVSLVTVRRFETGMPLGEETRLKIEGALQKAGVAFFGAEQPSTTLKCGVGLTQSARPRPRPKQRVYKPRKPKAEAAKSNGDA